MSKRLELRFQNEEGRNVTIALDEPVEPTDEEQISQVMDTLLEENVFISNGGDLTKKRDARIVERTVTTVYEN
ncbi:DUF2922 domain-containing protein [Aliibacillus thermotolerans]|uniref:DUF2922 domain-containing protein n=1 Tax=Aliibacillus thermotolerans TaxID=1834418 RepID=A0ABW0U2Z3_9BACI|nr:DUF2922 domain-containing protein [Aliibacillus thermotolerans]MDA3129247.1 DUF2922 family protein [Aliibacillus thermotolerans]